MHLKYHWAPSILDRITTLCKVKVVKSPFLSSVKFSSSCLKKVIKKELFLKLFFYPVKFLPGARLNLPGHRVNLTGKKNYMMGGLTFWKSCFYNLTFFKLFFHNFLKKSFFFNNFLKKKKKIITLNFFLYPVKFTRAPSKFTRGPSKFTRGPSKFTRAPGKLDR